MTDNGTPARAERGPLRPPSESRSLLVRVVRNCPWNKCTFCPAYKHEKFSLRSPDEIMADIEQAAFEPGRPDIKFVFLQDADALIMPADTLKPIIRFIRHTLPRVERITAYARSNTLVHRTVAELAHLREAGLTRIHVGLESGCDDVLTFVRKGVSAAKQLDGCRRVKEAGLELCCYVMPGLGGRRFTVPHAIDTGRLIAAIEPHHVRLRTCFVLEGTPLADAYTAGLFQPLGEEEIVREIRIFLTKISRTRTELISDHRINLLLELHGKLPYEYDQLLGTIDRFLDLNAEEKKLFIAGRRLGLLRRLDEFFREDIRAHIRIEAHRYSPIVPAPSNLLY